MELMLVQQKRNIDLAWRLPRLTIVTYFRLNAALPRASAERGFCGMKRRGIALLLAVGVGCSGEEAQIGGLVSDRITTQPILGALVELSSGASQLTDARGTFLFSNLESDTSYTLQVSVDGFVTQTQTLTAREGTSASHTFALERAEPDAGGDAGIIDTGVGDTGVFEDAGVVDTGVVEDTGIVDAGVVDAGFEDTGIVDTGVIDAGFEDTGIVDTGVIDAGIVDTGIVDTGVDAGVRCGELLPPEGMVEVCEGTFFRGCCDSAAVADGLCEVVDNECFTGQEVEIKSQPNVDRFYIDTYEITVAQYRDCVNARACDAIDTQGNDECVTNFPNRDDHPITCVNWFQANDYCQSIGKRLPSEDEWEKAARGVDGRIYPWGNARYDADPAPGLVANIRDLTHNEATSTSGGLATYDDGFHRTAPVGNYPAGVSPYGAMDMVGNVAEWTSSLFSDNLNSRVLRGGSWRFGPEHGRVSRRASTLTTYADQNLGFRCVLSATP